MMAQMVDRSPGVLNSLLMYIFTLFRFQITYVGSCRQTCDDDVLCDLELLCLHTLTYKLALQIQERLPHSRPKP